MQTIYPLSKKYLFFGPLYSHLLTLFSLAGLIFTNLYGLDKVVSTSRYDLSYTAIFLIWLVIGLISFARHVYIYFRYRDSFLTVTPQGIVLCGISIPWRLIEVKIVSSRLVIHVTNQTELDLKPLLQLGIGMYPANRWHVMMVRGDIYLPSWFFDLSLQEVAQVLQTSEPKQTEQYSSEKRHEKTVGKTWVMKRMWFAGLVITAIYVVYIVNFVIREGWNTEVIVLPLILLSALWYVLLSTFSDKR